MKPETSPQVASLKDLLRARRREIGLAFAGIVLATGCSVAGLSLFALSKQHDASMVYFDYSQSQIGAAVLGRGLEVDLVWPPNIRTVEITPCLPSKKSRTGYIQTKTTEPFLHTGVTFINRLNCTP